jgi:hypothetical protein
MPTLYFLHPTDAGKADQLELLGLKLPAHRVTLGITEAEVAGVQADALAFRYALTVNNMIQSYAMQSTSYKNELRDGGSDNAVLLPPPVLPTPIPPAVAPGIVPRLAAFVARIKTSPNYTEAIGRDLGIIGAERAINPTTWKPALAVTLASGHPQLQWTKGKSDSLELWVDRGNGAGFLFYDICTATHLVDASPTPPTSALWRYKAIFRLHDQQVGNWSDVTSVAVGV